MDSYFIHRIKYKQKEFEAFIWKDKIFNKYIGVYFLKYGSIASFELDSNFNNAKNININFNIISQLYELVRNLKNDVSIIGKIQSYLINILIKWKYSDHHIDWVNDILSKDNNYITNKINKNQLFSLEDL